MEDIALEFEMLRCVWESQSPEESLELFLSHRQQRIGLPETSKRIADDSGIKDIRSHYMLVRELSLMRDRVRSGRAFKPGSKAWALPRKVTTWKTGRPKLLSFANKLWSLEGPLREIARDQVLLGAIQHIDHGGRFPKLVGALVALAELAQAAAEIKGKKGNRAHPDWTIEATKMCRSFWRGQMHKEPKPYFKQDPTTEPANDFSRWFCQVMSVVAGLTDSGCKTILNRKK
jgi:hypothetical protein